MPQGGSVLKLSAGMPELFSRRLKSGAEIAVRMTEYSAANINAIVKSNVAFVEVTPTMSRDWMRFGREGIEHGFDRFKCLLQYRAPSASCRFTKRSRAWQS